MLPTAARLSRRCCGLSTSAGAPRLFAAASASAFARRPFQLRPQRAALHFAVTRSHQESSAFGHAGASASGVVCTASARHSHSDSSSSTAASSSSPSLLSAAACVALASLASWLLLGPSDVHAAAAGAAPSSSSPASASASSPQQLPHGRLPSVLSLVEKARLRELKAWIRDLPSGPERDYIRKWALPNDWTLLRYLIAHDLNLSAAGGGLVATARWRLEEGVDGLRAEEFRGDLAGGGLYVSKEADPLGRAIIVHRKCPKEKAGDHVWAPELQRRETRCLVYTLERAAREMEDRVDAGLADPELLDHKWTFLVDVSGFSRGSAAPVSATKHMLEMMRDHYPERLNYLLLVEPTWWMRTVGAFVRPFIPALTRLKIGWVDDRTSLRTQQMFTVCVGSLDRLPVDWNLIGARTPFDFEAYMATDPLTRPRPEPTPFRKSHQVLQAEAAAEAAAAYVSAAAKADKPWYAIPATSKLNGHVGDEAGRKKSSWVP